MLGVLLPLAGLCQAYTWEKLSHKSKGITVKQLEVSPAGTLYALTDDAFVYYSTNSGNTWQPFAYPPFLSFLTGPLAFHLNKSTNRLFIGTELNGLSYTSNYGASWGQEFLSTSTVSATHEGVSAISSIDDTVVVAGDGVFGSPGAQRYFYSLNNGNSWLGPVLSNGIANDLLAEAGRWIVGSSNGLQVTVNKGVSWTYLAFSGGQVFFVEKDNVGNYYAVVRTAANTYVVYTSTNLTSWTALQTLVRSSFHAFNFAQQSNSLLMSTSSGLEKLSLATNSLTLLSVDPVWEGEEHSSANAVAYGAQNLTGVNYGLSPAYAWQLKSNGFMDVLPTQYDKFVVSKNNIFSSKFYNHILSRMKNLDSLQWSHSFYGAVTSFTGGTSTLFLETTPNNYIFTGSIRDLYRSADSGLTWQSVSNPGVLPYNNNGQHFFENLTAGKNGFLFARQSFDSLRIYLSKNNGSTWQKILDQNKLQAMGMNAIFVNNAVSDYVGNIYVSLQTMSLANKFIMSADTGATWTNVSPANASLLAGSFKIYIDKLNQLLISAGPKLYTFGPVLAPVTTSWDPQSTDITQVELAFTAQNKMYANVIGSEFCTDCGLYLKTASSWIGYGSPAILAGYTPINNLDLLRDSMPVVTTRYIPTIGSIGKMGFYTLKPAVATALTEESPARNGLLVFPNPGSDAITILAPEPVDEAAVYSVLGCLVKVSRVTQVIQLRLEVADLAEGAYFIETRSHAGKRHRAKFVKN